MTALLAVAAAGVGVHLLPAEASARPDLVVPSLANPPKQLEGGKRFKASVVVRNVGKRRAGPSVTRLFLSPTKQRSKRAIRLGGQLRTKALRPRQSRRGKPRLTVPKATPSKRHYLIACADATRRVRESKERNNCRTARRPVRVSAGRAGGTFPLPAKPLNVKPSLDASRATTATISRAGGNVEARSANGSAYTLRVPKDAVASPTEITLTPITSIEGMPFSRLAGAVDMKPDGLQLARSATLEIRPAKAVGVGGRAGFMYHGDGRDFHLYPFTRTKGASSAVEMRLTHFSAAGVAEATASQVKSAFTRMPAAPGAQLHHLVGQALLQAERAACPAPCQTLTAAQEEALSREAAKAERIIVSQLERFARDVLLSAIDKGTANRHYAEHALEAYLAWYELVLLFVNDELDALQDRVEGSMKDLVDSAIRGALTQCVVGRTPWELEIIHMWFELVLLGIPRHANTEGVAENAVRRCNRFRFSLNSKIHINGPHGETNNGSHQAGGAEARVRTDIVVSVGDAGDAFEDELHYASYRRWDPSCVAFNRFDYGHPFRVYRPLTLRWNENRKAHPDGRVTYDPELKEVVATISHGSSAEQHTNNCPILDKGPFTRNVWYEGFLRRHGHERVGGEVAHNCSHNSPAGFGHDDPLSYSVHRFQIKNWAWKGPHQFEATKSYAGASTPCPHEPSHFRTTFTEDTTLQLVHDPSTAGP